MMFIRQKTHIPLILLFIILLLLPPTSDRRLDVCNHVFDRMVMASKVGGEARKEEGKRRPRREGKDEAEEKLEGEVA